MTSGAVGVIGATSMVGHHALNLLKDAGYSVFAFSRGVKSPFTDTQGNNWSNFRLDSPIDTDKARLEDWICFCPITGLSDHFEMIERSGARKVVALSSTSRFTKAASAAGFNADEVNLSEQLVTSEAKFEAWATRLGIDWVILRPTLIYDFVHDKNLALVAHFIKRFGFFPLLGKAGGLRQPVYAGDVAQAAISALETAFAANHDYNLSGGEVLSYKDMVLRIFVYAGRKPRLLKVPLLGFKLLIMGARILPRYRHLSSTMAERMNSDLVFDHGKAKADFGYAPAQFLGGGATLHKDKRDLKNKTKNF